MIGSNKLNVNLATLTEIVQQWVDRTFHEGVAPKVSAVSFDNEYASPTLVIHLTEKSAP